MQSRVPALQRRILNSLPVDSRDRAIWLSASGDHTGAGFAMIPHTGELRMLDPAFLNTACSRVGIALPFLAALGGRNFDCGLCKKLLHGEIGGHALTCTGIAKTARHNIIVRALADELSAPLSHTGARRSATCYLLSPWANTYTINNVGPSRHSYARCGHRDYRGGSPDGTDRPHGDHPDCHAERGQPGSGSGV